MVCRLVIVRHAKTEQRRPDRADSDREVTKSGMRACRVGIPRAMGLLAGVDRSSITIWASPARRAIQTAAVIAEALDVEGIDLHPALYADDASRVLSELREASGTVVVVGHNPLLEELYRMLAGHPQTLEKCAAASFVFDGSGAPSLEWFVQGPDHRRWKTLSQVEHALKRTWAGINEGKGAFIADPLDIETLHRYRIALRVARSLVQFLEPYFRRPVVQKVEAALRDLARETSRLRELDVFASEIHARGDLGADGGRIVLELEIERNAARAALMDELCDSTDSKRLRRIKRFLKDPVWKRSVEERGLGESELPARFDAMCAELEAEIRTCDFEDVEATHDVRKRSKRLRYVARELKPLLGDERSGQGHEARELQELLGQVCDARVNADLAESFGDEALAREQREQAESLVQGLHEPQ